MPPLSRTTAAAALHADAMCRGIGTASERAGAAWLAIPADMSAGPAEPAAAREVVRVATTGAVRREAWERVVDCGHRDEADAHAHPDDAPSPELLRRLAHLRATVTRYVWGRRAAGVPVERVLPEVKGLVREAMAREGWCDPSDTLLAPVVRWAITAYVERPELAHVPHVD
jgi:hypothetical protein